MQNQYFGDIHDFYKYLFLKKVAGDSSLGIHWCLVPNEGGRAGQKPLTLKEYKIDHELYTMLTQTKVRDIDNIKPYFSKYLSRHGVKYFTELHEHFYSDFMYEERAVKCLGSQNIIFFDPDNGIEVSSTNNKNKYKFVSYRLLQRFWNMGKSLIIYQHNDRRVNSLDTKIEILYNLLEQKPNINIVKRNNVNYICVINGSIDAEHYISLDILAQMKYDNNYTVENWRGTGGIA